MRATQPTLRETKLFSDAPVHFLKWHNPAGFHVIATGLYRVMIFLALQRFHRPAMHFRIGEDVHLLRLCVFDLDAFRLLVESESLLIG